MIMIENKRFQIIQILIIFPFTFLLLLANLCKGCFGNPCENNAVCVDVSKEPTSDEKFHCNCPVPFFGRKCEKWGKIIINV